MKQLIKKIKFTSKATFSTLEENEQEALQLLVEILQESVFDQEK